MVSKKLLGFWAFFDICLLAAGVLSLVLSIVWRSPNLLLNLTFYPINLNVGTYLGVLFLSTVLISIAAIIQRNHITRGLVFLNWVLLANGISILVVGTYLWVHTLNQRSDYHTAFAAQDNTTRISIQDTLQCCGYFNSTDMLILGGSFCPTAAAAAAANSICVTPIVKYADDTLNDIFSTIYGFMAIAFALFLATMCVIKEREEIERFKKIDAKRGGKGFV